MKQTSVLKMKRGNKRAGEVGAVMTVNDRKITITCDYTPLKKMIFKRGFSSWAAFRRFSGLSLNTVVDMSKGRPVSIELLAYIAYILGVGIQDVIRFNYTEEKSGEEAEPTPKEAAKKQAEEAAKEDAALRRKIEAARALGLLNSLDDKKKK